MTNRTAPILLVQYLDPRHSWLAVPRSLITQLGIINLISSFSYADAHTIFLEEDEDMPLFMQAAENAGLDYRVELCGSDEPSMVRELPLFSVNTPD